MSRIFAAITMVIAMAVYLASPMAADARGGGGGGGDGGGRGGGGGGGGRSFSGGGGGRSFSGGGGRSFSPSMGGGRSFSTNAGNFNRGNWSGNWNRGENWARSGNWNGNWNREGNWNRNWAGNWNNWNRGRGFRDNDFWWWGIAPLVGSLWGNWYPGYWDNGYYGYPAYYGYDYDSQPQYDYSSQPTYSTEPVRSTMTSGGEEYLNQAASAFQSGNYREAQRLAGHAIVDEPQNPQAHAIICLAAFATGNYQAAAAEAHAVASINGVPSWSQIYGVYQDLDKFTTQLRQLESDARQHPQDVHAQFLLGFLYMTMGYRAEAQEHLAKVAERMPNDRLAANLLGEAGGQVPATASRSNAPQSYDRTAPDQPMNPVAPRTPPAGPPADSRGSRGGNQPLPPSGGPRPAPAGTPGGTET